MHGHKSSVYWVHGAELCKVKMIPFPTVLWFFVLRPFYSIFISSTWPLRLKQCIISFHAGLLFPGVISSYLLNWKPNDQDRGNARTFPSPKNRPTGSQSAAFINSDIHRTFYDMLFFLPFTLNWADNRERGKNVSARLLFPTDQKFCL